MKVFKGILKFVLVLVLLLALVVGGYVGYVALQYSRIADYTPVAVENQQAQKLVAGQEYTAVTFNIGFGAYDHDFAFFMDEGTMADGTKVKGTSARAESEHAVRTNTLGAIETLLALNPDIVLLQEVDEAATRSYSINQVQSMRESFPAHANSYASNFHTPYLMYPLTQPIGSIESGIMTLSRYEIGDSLRRTYPVDESFPQKFFDLDRCFTVQYLPVEGSSAQLVLINTHMSAYDEGGVYRNQQLQMLFGMMQAERDKGNYVIVGGDFNHALVPVDTFPSGQQVPPWVVPFEADIPDGFWLVGATNTYDVATVRGSDIAYTKGVNYTTVLDGFIVSDNVSASAFNIDADFMYSDHNPVQLRFSLVPIESSEEAPAEGEEGAVEGEGGEGEEAPAEGEEEQPVG